MTFLKDTIENFPSLNFLKYFLIDDIKCCVAGGCFKNIFSYEPAKDIDIFFESKEHLEKMIEKFKIGKFKDDYEEIYNTKNVIGYKHKSHKTKVELVKSTFGTAEEIISKFDFSVVKFAMFKMAVDKVVDGKIFKEDSYPVVYHKQFFEHLHMKKLVIDHDIPFPLSTFNRIIRYARYGFVPCRESKLKIISAIKNLPEKQAIEIAKELYESFD